MIQILHRRGFLASALMVAAGCSPPGYHSVSFTPEERAKLEAQAERDEGVPIKAVRPNTKKASRGPGRR
ncbi:MAG: hypothetical protein U0790_12970 [Isosphaeraceae bacterium]